MYKHALLGDYSSKIFLPVKIAVGYKKSLGPLYASNLNGAKTDSIQLTFNSLRFSNLPRF